MKRNPGNEKPKKRRKREFFTHLGESPQFWTKQKKEQDEIKNLAAKIREDMEKKSGKKKRRESLGQSVRLGF